MPDAPHTGLDVGDGAMCGVMLDDDVEAAVPVAVVGAAVADAVVGAGVGGAVSEAVGLVPKLTDAVALGVAGGGGTAASKNAGPSELVHAQNM